MPASSCSSSEEKRGTLPLPREVCWEERKKQAGYHRKKFAHSPAKQRLFAQEEHKHTSMLLPCGAVSKAPDTGTPHPWCQVLCNLARRHATLQSRRGNGRLPPQLGHRAANGLQQLAAVLHPHSQLLHRRQHLRLQVHRRTPGCSRRCRRRRRVGGCSCVGRSPQSGQLQLLHAARHCSRRRSSCAACCNAIHGRSRTLL